MARRKRRKDKPFIGDRLLALLLLLDSCLCVGSLGLLSAAGFGIRAGITFRDGLRKAVARPEFDQVFGPVHGVVLATVAVVIAVVAVWFASSLWAGRRWALWAALSLHVPGAVVPFVYGGEALFSAILPASVALYCATRLAGHFGPKP